MPPACQWDERIEIAADNPFTAILSDSETILWSGQPDYSSALRDHRKAQLTITAVILTFFCVSVVSSVVENGKADWGIVSLYLFVIAFWFAIAAFSYNQVDGQDWHYAITDKQFLFYDPHSEGSNLIQRLEFYRIKRVTVRPRSGSVGNIIFKTKFLALEHGLIFYHVADAAKVQELVVSLLMSERRFV